MVARFRKGTHTHLRIGGLRVTPAVARLARKGISAAIGGEISHSSPIVFLACEKGLHGLRTGWGLFYYSIYTDPVQMFFVALVQR